MVGKQLGEALWFEWMHCVHSTRRVSPERIQSTFYL